MKRPARATGSMCFAAAIVVISCLLASGVAAQGQDSASTAPVYRMPPRAIADLIDAPPTPGVSIGPKQQWMLIMERPSLPSIAEVSQPELRLAGMRINPRTNGRSRRSYNTKLILKRIADGSEKTIRGLAPHARIRNIRWSPNEQRIAFSVTRETGIELWVADVATAQARRLTEPRLNAAYGSPYNWSPDSESLICLMVPSGRGMAPAAPTVPAGPTLQENIGGKAPARTYQDLLKNAHDVTLFGHYFTSQVVRVTLTGKSELLGKPGIFAEADPSPDGRYILTEIVHKPYSYLVPASRFPRRVEIWDGTGRVVKTVADIPLAEQVPIGFGAVRTGPRSFGWRADEPATLYWAEAQDGGDPKKEVEVRDRVYVLATPFAGQPIELVSLGMRYSGMSWGNDKLALVNEWWWKNRRSRTWIVNPSAPASEPTLLFDRSFEDRYSDPGRPLFRRTDAGTSVLLTADSGRTLFLSGQGASPEGNRPFLDRLALATKKTERLWRSEAPYYESAVNLLDAEKLTLLTRRESKNEPPNYFVRDLQKQDTTALTTFPHPTPALKEVYKEMLRYQRADGVKLTATLYLPPGKTPKDGPFPMLMMAYPREFKSADAAGQVTDSPHRFVRTSAHSPLLWLVHGYAVLDGPTLPIIGEGDEEPNDTYIKQLVSGAQAAVDEVVRLGVADRDRIAIISMGNGPSLGVLPGGR